MIKHEPHANLLCVYVKHQEDQKDTLDNIDLLSNEPMFHVILNLKKYQVVCIVKVRQHEVKPKDNYLDWSAWVI